MWIPHGYSKMYNAVHLCKSYWCYQMYFWNNDLNIGQPNWVDNFQMIQESCDVTLNRAIIPKNAINLSIDTLDTAAANIQLICVAIYARFKLNNGEYSCQLVFARTKIVPKEMSIPRTELIFAATLNSTTCHVVKISFGEYFGRPLKLTDSQIVLHWINCPRSELKLRMRNRVIGINRLTELKVVVYKK